MSQKSTHCVKRILASTVLVLSLVSATALATDIVPDVEEQFPDDAVTQTADDSLSQEEAPLEVLLDQETPQEQENAENTLQTQDIQDTEESLDLDDFVDVSLYEENLDPEPENDPDTDPEFSADPDTELEPATDPDTDSDLTIDSDTESEPTTDSDTESDPSADLYTDSDPAIDPDTEPEPTTDTDSESEPTIDPDAESEFTTDPDTDSDLAIDSDSEPEPATNPDTEPEPAIDESIDPELSSDQNEDSSLPLNTEDTSVSDSLDTDTSAITEDTLSQEEPQTIDTSEVLNDTDTVTSSDDVRTKDIADTQDEADTSGIAILEVSSDDTAKAQDTDSKQEESETLLLVASQEGTNATVAANKEDIKYYNPLTGETTTVSCTLIDGNFEGINESGNCKINESGWYAVKNYVSVSSFDVNAKDVNIILCKGATLKLSGPMNVSSNSSLSIWGEGKDENSGSIISDNYGVQVGSNGSLTMYGGSIINQQSGASVNNNGIFTMYGGTVSNTASCDAVRNYREFTMSGGTVSSTGWGVDNEGTFTITKGVIIGSRAIYGTVKNTVSGTAWENPAGTGAVATIPAAESGQTISPAYQRVQFPAYTISTSVSPDGSGTVTEGATYPIGSEVTLTATPNPGYVFKNWTEGSSVFTDNPYVFSAASDRNLVANFLGIVVDDIATQTFSGEEFTPEITVSDAVTSITLSEGTHYTVSYQKQNGEGWDSVEKINSAGTYRAVVSGAGDYAGVEVTKEFSVMLMVQYIDDKGNLKEHGCTAITSSDSNMTIMQDGWYAVTEDVQAPLIQIQNGANVTLILCDNTTLTMNNYINITGRSSLTIYG
ncbi:MAG: hypothetical protein IKE43_01025, partial [Coriobacteriales bacterium]|nr:hypothetical protein [Coriobacteriales bacterium]